MSTRLKVWSLVMAFTLLMVIVAVAEGSIVAIVALVGAAFVLVTVVASRMRKLK
jgi:hypothetical protein